MTLFHEPPLLEEERAELERPLSAEEVAELEQLGKLLGIDPPKSGRHYPKVRICGHLVSDSKQKRKNRKRYPKNSSGQGRAA